jgi:FkbM family methyltransferase
MVKSQPTIFDIGAHNGDDTEFYLGKGFDVVAVEANPHLVRVLAERFPAAIKEKRLAVVERAIVRGPEKEIPFYINVDKDDWSSVRQSWAVKDGMAVETVRVRTVRLAELFRKFGVPHFLKVDIEGGDEDVARSLSDVPVLPEFVSFEMHNPIILAILATAGYTEFQLVNQWFNGFITPLDESREGTNYWPEAGGFGSFHSGLFGRDLPSDEWLSLEETMALFVANQAARKTGLMKTSWWDVHARRSPAEGGK